ncbi:hypothetical protein K437DRAFT_253671 [Tilletiaria anomala UBC 951]|uniref:Uncharacterized protein n=1 Tax=Tilletiaria anomala (strain ATCC 24038 / CBS 436.72 / UBC 951) TaxID=1037660 RepID=A0A066WKC2_TILAU|nr:uncharacterized protein K437DRAFT_253671 [Tilletiaria anomala UBC 951]KDN53018.1 hypothetical protein K437DRAFT_253671 [Tilletiaria anomala UBC 951]
MQSDDHRPASRDASCDLLPTGKRDHHDVVGVEPDLDSGIPNDSVTRRIRPPILPPEILHDILLLACDLDPRIPHTLAYVSHAVCALTAPARFKTVVLTSEASLASFWLLLQLHNVTRLVCDEWALPTAFADALTVRATEVEAQLQLGNDAATRAVLMQQFGCTINPKERWSSIDCGPRRNDASRYQGIEPLYPERPSETQQLDAADSTQRRYKYLSYPTEKPLSQYIENLLIDLDPCTIPEPTPLPSDARLQDQDDADEAPDLFPAPRTQGGQQQRGNILMLTDELDTLRERIASHLSLILQLVYNAPWHLVQKVRQLPVRHGHRLCHMLEHVPNVQRLSLGGMELQAFSGCFSARELCPRELTLVHNGDDESLDMLVKSFGGAAEEVSVLEEKASSHSMRTRSGESFPAKQRQTGPAYILPGIRQRLEKLHVIGIDPRSPLTGVSVPFPQFYALRAGAIMPGSYIEACIEAEETFAKSQKACMAMLFDHLQKSGCAIEPERLACMSEDELKKLGFPAVLCRGVDEDVHSSDLLATWRRVAPRSLSRARHLQCLSPEDISKGVRYLRYDTPKFSLRPVEVIGSKLRYFIQELCDSANIMNVAGQSGTVTRGECSAQDAVRAWGAGTFVKLQLAWQTAQGSAMPNATSAAHRSRFSSFVPFAFSSSSTIPSNGISGAHSAAGGWPREVKDVWTERTDRDLPLSFGHELVEAVRQAFGWAKPPQWESSFLSSLRQGDSPTIRAHAANLGPLIDRIMGEFSVADGSAVNGFASVMGDYQGGGGGRIPADFSTFELRRPSEFMRFEGSAAFEKEERIRLFLDSAAGGKGAWS